MAVYTVLAFDAAAALVDRLGLGTLSALEPIASGIENTNYFADTRSGRYVLTVFERLGFEQLPFYLGLMKHLAEHGLPVPAPKADADGGLVHRLADKPAAVVDRLPGSHRLAPDAAHCALLGAMLGRMHLAGADFALAQPNLRGLDWWAESVPIVAPFVSHAERALLQSELDWQRRLAASPAQAGLPRGPIHADLFRDNVMFVEGPDGDRIGGLFDFYFAGVDTWLYDLAVCLNDWCIDLESGRLAEDRASALVRAYHEARPLGATECRLLPAAMRAGAFRFWLSRLRDLHQPREAALLTAHDPAHFERVLRERIANPWHPPIR